MRKPLLNMTQFTKQHEDQLHMMQKYMTTKRGRRAVDDITAENFKYPAAVSLKATSSLARIAVAGAANKVFTKNLGLMKNPEFLTLCPREFAVPLPEAASFQTSTLIDWAHDILGGSSYVGIVDLAYYSNLPLKAGVDTTAHFHVHAIRWNDEGQPAVPAVNDAALAQALSLVPGLKPYHVRPLDDLMIPERAIYMSKMPLSEYRVYRRMTEEIDPVTGEVFKIPTDRYIQKKRALRPGAVAKIARIFGDHDIPSLAFAGGTGVQMLDTVFQKARRHVARNKPVVRPTAANYFSRLI